MDRCPPSRASAARVLGGCRGPRYGLGWQLGRTQHDDFAATLGPRALRPQVKRARAHPAPRWRSHVDAADAARAAGRSAVTWVEDTSLVSASAGQGLYWPGPRRRRTKPAAAVVGPARARPPPATAPARGSPSSTMLMSRQPGRVRGGKHKQPESRSVEAHAAR